MWFTVLACIVAVVAIGYTIFLKTPLNDRGHRCFAVPSEQAAKVVAEVLGQSGLREQFTFDAGPTTQTVFSDNLTVLIWHEEETSGPNGLSMAVANPRESANEAVRILRDAGFTTTYRTFEDLGDNLVVVGSNAFDGWSLVFRRHIVKMGQPPNERRITD